MSEQVAPTVDLTGTGWSASLGIWTMLKQFVDGWQPAFVDAGDGEERWHWSTPAPVPTGHPPQVVLATAEEAGVLDALMATGGVRPLRLFGHTHPLFSKDAPCSESVLGLNCTGAKPFKLLYIRDGG